ncbi:MAG: hypothetical protein JWO38_8346 [Gemmataceae bacterium]|nr:hypothetical protein [Gemmataceae bacterium]
MRLRSSVGIDRCFVDIPEESMARGFHPVGVKTRPAPKPCHLLPPGFKTTRSTPKRRILPTDPNFQRQSASRRRDRFSHTGHARSILRTEPNSRRCSPLHWFDWRSRARHMGSILRTEPNSLRRVRTWWQPSRSGPQGEGSILRTEPNSDRGVRPRWRPSVSHPPDGWPFLRTEPNFRRHYVSCQIDCLTLAGLEVGSAICSKTRTRRGTVKPCQGLPPATHSRIATHGGHIADGMIDGTDDP